jgi:selenocysteine lyase/cysteine desulfurase
MGRNGTTLTGNATVLTGLLSNGPMVRKITLLMGSVLSSLKMDNKNTVVRLGTVDYDVLMSSVVATAERYGLTLNEFISAGKDGNLTVDELQELWLSVSAVLRRVI